MAFPSQLFSHLESPVSKGLYSTLHHTLTGGCWVAPLARPLSPQGVVSVSKAIPRSASVVLSAALVLLVLAVAFVPAATEAGSHPKQVRGYVYDQTGRKVADAQVTVTMKDGETQISAKTDTSDSTGYFSCSFGTTEWYIGNRIVVTATYQSLQATNSTEVYCDDAFFQWENVTFPYEIPEFGGGFVGLLITGLLLGAVAVGALVFVRRK